MAAPIKATILAFGKTCNFTAKTQRRQGFLCVKNIVLRCEYQDENEKMRRGENEMRRQDDWGILVKLSVLMWLSG